MPKISTGIGDNGTTSICGITMSKDDPIADALGSIDELTSSLGLISAEDNNLKEKMKHIQKSLYLMCADLAGDSNKITTEHVKEIEEQENVLEKELPELKKFIVPGGSKNSALLHISRAICRRAERNVVKIMRTHKINKNVLIYLNRLSDLLFLMARKQNLDKKVKDEGLGA